MPEYNLTENACFLPRGSNLLKKHSSKISWRVRNEHKKLYFCAICYLDGQKKNKVLRNAQWKNIAIAAKIWYNTQVWYAMKREIAADGRVTFVEYVRSSGGRVRCGAPQTLHSIAFFPETTHTDADVWANPVFVRGTMKRAARCQNGLAPNANCASAHCLHLII